MTNKARRRRKLKKYMDGERFKLNYGEAFLLTVSKLVENYLRMKNKTIQLNKDFYPYSKNEPMNFWGNGEKMGRVIKL